MTKELLAAHKLEMQYDKTINCRPCSICENSPVCRMECSDFMFYARTESHTARHKNYINKLKLTLLSKGMSFEEAAL